MKSLYEDLMWRGLIQDCSNPEELKNQLDNNKLSFYIGTDPTADSLHIGHYPSFLLAKRLVNYGHHGIMLVGGATAQIGDPRGTGERSLLPLEVVNANYEKLKKQVERIFGCETVNNYDWIKNISTLEFLRDYGKHFPINYMLSKDKVKKQLDNGLSFTEFSYMILQALDFKYLHDNKGVTLQVAGSDQWGNITSGIELIRRTEGVETYAFTMPLILDENGKKIGKSEGNAMWLDRDKTSPYELYQYLLNTDDSVVINHLKTMTLLDKEEIEKIEKEQLEAPHLRVAQKALAKAVICDVHSEEDYNSVMKISEALFSGKLKELTKEEILDAFKNIPSYEVNEDKNIITLLVEAGICSSNREAREFVNNKAISVNGEILNDINADIRQDDSLVDNYTIIRKGKKKYFVIKHV